MELPAKAIQADMGIMALAQDGLIPEQPCQAALITAVVAVAVQGQKATAGFLMVAMPMAVEGLPAQLLVQA
jgi:hypothetical protein